MTWPSDIPYRRGFFRLGHAHSARQAVVGNRVSVGQALPEQADDDAHHLRQRDQRADIAPARELVDIALQGLRTDLVVSAGVAALEHRPEAIDPARL